MEVDFIFKIAAIGIIVAVLYQVLSRSGREEYATLTVIAGIAVIVMMLLPCILQTFLQTALSFYI